MPAVPCCRTLARAGGPAAAMPASNHDSNDWPESAAAVPRQANPGLDPPLPPILYSTVAPGGRGLASRAQSVAQMRVRPKVRPKLLRTVDVRRHPQYHGVMAGVARAHHHLVTLTRRAAEWIAEWVAEWAAGAGRTGCGSHCNSLPCIREGLPWIQSRISGVSLVGDSDRLPPVPTPMACCVAARLAGRPVAAAPFVSAA